MMGIPSYDKLEEFSRVRLSSNFFMRDFLYSEIAAWHGLTNLPHFPEQAIAVGRKLCEELLEPLQATFGRIHIRSAYRSPEVTTSATRISSTAPATRQTMPGISGTTPMRMENGEQLPAS